MEIGRRRNGIGATIAGDVAIGLALPTVRGTSVLGVIAIMRHPRRAHPLAENLDEPIDKGIRVEGVHDCSRGKRPDFGTGNGG
ncbi:MAG: hypothetical protein KatS3mg060_3624 [Dehalococcoidia bacterium]|nr:MAG: hypothetical protein KatS3mg060_3624 [Dehalococcoidia bacterium]